ncbi:hypothetical protein KC901_00765 [Patescibacteria group bacterium]|nr:hypothetical protein [Patescibacteria group bacterium]
MDIHILTKEAETILTMMDIHVKDISVSTDPDLRITVLSIRISGTDQEIFTEQHNTLTRDFSLILKIILEKKHHYYKDVVVDINGDNQKLIDYTKEKAAIAVERVRFFDKPYEFGYLNAYERMLIHHYFKNIPELITESSGEGKDRRLTVKKKQS